jgi:hypothetical protein
MHLDVLANFFFGLFVLFTNTFGFGCCGQCYDAKGYDHYPTHSDYCGHFFNTPKILALIARAQLGSGKCHPTNAPTAIQNIMSNMMILLLFNYNAGKLCAGPNGRPVVGQVGVAVPNAGTGADPNADGAPNPVAGAPNDDPLLNPPAAD